MSKPRNRYQRARLRARARRPRQRRGGSLGWTVAIVVIVVLGVGAVILTRQERDASADVPPRPALSADDPGDHWHAYLGVNVCGDWLANAPEFEYQAGSGEAIAGIHSHGDGLVHIHPYSRAESGENATLGRFIDYGGWELSADSFTLWDGVEHRDGQQCQSGADQGKEARVVWSVNGELRTGNPADYKPADGDVIAIGFLPEGSELGEPPGAAAALQAPSDQVPTDTSVPETPAEIPTDTTVPVTPSS